MTALGDALLFSANDVTYREGGWKLPLLAVEGLLFADGFESGHVNAWPVAQQ